MAGAAETAQKIQAGAMTLASEKFCPIPASARKIAAQALERWEKIPKDSRTHSGQVLTIAQKIARSEGLTPDQAWMLHASFRHAWRERRRSHSGVWDYRVDLMGGDPMYRSVARFIRRRTRPDHVKTLR